jgi:phosphopantothenoylcysteine decarboxylase/phosphopantothenate--cysteine ligase
MLEPDEIVQDLIAAFQPKLLAGRKLLVTAGPTYEAIDPVRGITNLSSGKMGFAIARAAHEAGADVTLIAGPVHLPTPRGVQRMDVRSASDMHSAVLSQVDDASVFVSTAAVADWRVAQVAEQKIKKTAQGNTPDLQFTENPDILGEVAQTARAQNGELFCVGFAAESHDLQKHAQTKREKKGVPLLVGNIGPATFGSDENALLLVDAKGSQEVAQASKLTLARKLVAEIAQRMAH